MTKLFGYEICNDKPSEPARIGSTLHSPSSYLQIQNKPVHFNYFPFFSAHLHLDYKINRIIRCDAEPPSTQRLILVQRGLSIIHTIGYINPAAIEYI